MSERTKVVGLLVFLVALAAIFIGVNRGGSHPSSSTTANGSHLVLVKGRSFCIGFPAVGKLRFYFTVRNTGTSIGTVDATPWRRYSDASVNDSAFDTVTVRVPAGRTRHFIRFFDYRASSHAVIGCGFYWGDADTVTRIRVQS